MFHELTGLIVPIVAVVALLAFDALAVMFGADSRDAIVDDRHRP